MPCCRHWKELMQITGTQLDLAPEVFRLQHLLNAKLIAHRDEARIRPVLGTSRLTGPC